MQRQTNTLTHKQYRGFSIVEIVVVIAVMGILASISVVGYGAWRQRTAENEVKSDLNGVKTAMEAARNFTTGFPTGDINTIFQKSQNVTLTGGGQPNGKAYCVTAVSTARPTVSYYIDSTAANTSPQAGTCALTPSAPQNVSGTSEGAVIAPSFGQAYISWKEPLRSGSGVSGYNVRITFNPGCGSSSPVNLAFGLSSESGSNYMFNNQGSGLYDLYFYDEENNGSCYRFQNISGVYVSAASAQGYGPELTLTRAFTD